MKEQTEIQIKALSPKDNPETTRVACKSFIRQGPDNEIFHFFQFQNRGKGPPGRTRSPGKWDTMIPESKLNAEKNYQCSPSADGSIIKFYKKPLIFTIMKKQIFILIMAVFAASFSTAYGQALPGTKAAALSCTFTNPLNPVAGRAYDYSAIINPVGGSSYWYATKSTTFTTAGARVATEIPADGVLIANGALNYRTSAVSPTTPTITNVTWTADGLAGIDATHPLFMVVEYSGPTCANNIKVMQILPKIAFTVDITNMTHGATPASLAYGTAESQCYANVGSASFNAVSGKVDIDYGTNILYYEVIGANFTGTYKPTLKLSGLQGTQTATIDWGYAAGTIATNLVTDVVAPVVTPQFIVATSEATTNDGVSIYVKVTIKNHGWEGLANDNITLAVEAVDGTVAANKDVDTDCTTISDFGDLAIQTLNMRPTVTTDPASLVQIP